MDPKTKRASKAVKRQLRTDVAQQIKRFDRATLNQVSRPVPRTEKAYRNLGISRPKPRDMNRNVMLSQIENFDRTSLSALKPQQRYIVSPHDHVDNLFSNTLGMSAHAHSQGLPGIRPVFKDESQRKSFAEKVTTRLKSSTLTKTETSALNQMKRWSSSDSAMTDFSSVDTKRQHPIVYTQGHGAAGFGAIVSDDPSEAPVTGAKMAQQLIGMKLPTSSEVRANSCFSGTEKVVPSTATTRKAHRQQSVDMHHAGKWSKTFAGSLQAALNKRAGSHNRVAGYMGPTTQGATQVHKVGIGGIVHKDPQQGLRVRYGTGSAMVRAKRSQGRRYNQ